MTDDRSDPDTPAPGSGRKPRPPVIELKATDVTPEPTPGPKAEEPKQTRVESGQEAPKNSSSGGKLSGSPLFAGFLGLMGGALLLALAVLFAGGGIKNLFPTDASSDIALRDRLEQLLKSNADLEKRLAAIESRVKEIDTAPLAARVESVEGALSDLRYLVDQTQATNSLTGESFAARLNDLEAQLKLAARPPVANAAEVVALGALRDAIASGKSFEKELNSARAVLGDAAAPLAVLDPSAAAGLPTIAALRARFAELAPKLAREPAPEGGYFSKLLSNASRLVEVRPVGEAQGTSAGAVAARIETRLARNDLPAALDEAAQLPAAAKAEAEGWIADATKRRDADTTVKNLLNAALARSAEPAK